MRTRPVVMSALASVAVLVAGWELGAAPATGSPVVSTTSTASADDSASTPTPTPAPDSPTATPSPATSRAAGAGATPTPAPTTSETGLADGSYTGSAVTTRFGEVQVEITVAEGRITDVISLHLTDDDNRSVSISNRAAPILRQEVLAAQSAEVQAVSGATYTSDAYLTSLQSAIDQAGR